MPTAKPRVTITMDSEQLNKIEEYRFKHRCKNQTQAILSLIETGFSALKANGENSSSENLLTEDDIQVAKKYSHLDAHGKKIVNLVLNEESERNKLQKQENSNSEYIEFAARGGKFRLDKETAAKLAESAKKAPNSSQDRDMF